MARESMKVAVVQAAARPFDTAAAVEQVVRLTAELDLGEIARSRLDFDVVGHYARPDVFQLRVNEEPATSVAPGSQSSRRLQRPSTPSPPWTRCAP